MWRPEGIVKDSLGHWGFLDIEIKMLQHDIGILLHVSHLISPQIVERVFLVLSALPEPHHFSIKKKT